jgi:hypothetical protein
MDTYVILEIGMGMLMGMMPMRLGARLQLEAVSSSYTWLAIGKKK